MACGPPEMERLCRTPFDSDVSITEDISCDWDRIMTNVIQPSMDRW